MNKTQLRILTHLVEVYPEECPVGDIAKALRCNVSDLEEPLSKLDNDLHVSINGFTPGKKYSPVLPVDTTVEVTEKGMGYIEAVEDRKKEEPLVYVEEPDKGECTGLIEDKYRFLCFEDTKELLVYKAGVYVPGEPTVHKEVIRYYNEKKVSKHIANEVIFNIQVNNYIKRDVFDSDRNVINLKNGLLDIIDISEPELKRHCHTHFSFIQLPVSYDPDAKCENFIKFLSEVLPEKDIPIIQELFGYSLYQYYHIHKAFMFLGEGANGKSTLMNVIKMFVGPKNAASISLQRLNKERFGTGYLYGKLVNLCADLSPKKIYDAGNFKLSTSGDLLSGEKKHKDDFPFVNFAKHIFSANKLPEVGDQSDAFFRRWILINFPNKFEGDNDNKNILNEITTAWELSGILNWCLEGLERLLTNGCFSDGLTTDEIREDFIRKSNPPAAFCMDCLVEEPGEETPKRELHQAYLRYCETLKLPTVSENVFSRDHITHHLKNISSVRIGPKGNRVTAWRGARFKKEEEIVGDIGLVSGIQSAIPDTDENREEKHQEKLSGVKGVKDPSILGNTREATKTEGKNREKEEVENVKEEENILDTPDTPQKDRVTSLSGLLKKVFDDGSDQSREKWHKVKAIISENLTRRRINPEVFQRELSRCDVSILEQEGIREALGIKEVGAWLELSEEGLKILGVK